MTSTHNLPFLAAPWPRDPSVTAFKVGTCHGLWYTDKRSYYILSIINDVQGNGHLTDVFEWFEASAKRDGLSLKVTEIMNPAFKTHLLNKRGFTDIGGNAVEKKFTKHG